MVTSTGHLAAPQAGVSPRPAVHIHEEPAHSPLVPPASGYLPTLAPENTEFVVLSFEGPDPYSRAGGLGVRVTELTHALASRGFTTHLYFVGDPDAPGVEQVRGLPLHYHRWCQWISRYHPRGVYDGEEVKLADFRVSLPPHLVHKRIRPAVRQGKRVVVLSEEWHTAHTACDLADALWRAGLRDDVLMLWNANNTLGFEHVDFARLRFTQTICTVSRWMKHEMWRWGCNPVVLPNGIPARSLEPSPLAADLAEIAQRRLRDRLTLGKVARFDPDKRWLQAVDAVARLKRRGLPVLFIARGGLEAHGPEVLQRARETDLKVRDVHCRSQDPRALMRVLLDAVEGADVLNVHFYLSEPLKQALYRVADAMLQNSGREPFGLVGLEVMAAGGLVFTGATGEEYARSYDNAIVLDTDGPEEVQAAVMDLLSRPEEATRIRRRGTQTARSHTWDHALDLMLRRLQGLAVREEEDR